jgi:hypothetical protein
MAGFTSIIAQKLTAMISSVGGQIPTGLVQAGVGGALGVKMYGDGGYPAVGRNVIWKEKGYEMAQFLTPTRIYPNSMSRGGAGNVTININGARDPEAVARAVDMRLHQFFTGDRK